MPTIFLIRGVLIFKIITKILNIFWLFPKNRNIQILKVASALSELALSLDFLV